MEERKSLFADPFKVDQEDEQVDSLSPAIRQQPPATRWELWGYYLYYNGVQRALLILDVI